MFKLLDYMEYSSDALAQAAYVSNGTFPCLVFDGVNDVMSFPTSSIPLTSFTVEMWLWIGVRANYDQDIWHPSGKDWWLRCQEGDSPIIDTHIKDASNNYYNPSSISVEPEKWIHIAFQYDNSVGYVRNFLMGELNNEKDIGFKTFPKLDLGSSYPFGVLAAAAAAYFKGKAAKIRVWNTVRTESQLKANMYSNLVGNEDGLVLCLNTNEGSGESVDDVSSNNNNGTLSGTIWGTMDANATYLNTGGTITTDGNYTVHKFLLGASGTNFTVGKSGNVEVLIVAGGGAGGSRWSGGGGGGGVVYNASFAVTAQSYLVTVGDGGNPGNPVGSNGDNSVFSSLTALGGGAAGAEGSGSPDGLGKNGGSGGGGSVNANGGSATQPGSGSGGYGYAGGRGYSNGSGLLEAGGGGGAGSVGAPGVLGIRGGAGGAGLGYDISGTHTHYAGGGGGGSYESNNRCGAGTDGGGSAAHTGVAGTSDTGGGGGGSATGGTGGKGGSGIVIIRCLTSAFLSTPILQSYSESTIKTQGSYSLKGIAAITDSLNKTLTRTVSPTIDLTGINQVRFRIRSSRTGSNIKIGLHDSGGTTTEITPNILSADTWQEVKINLQNVANANKDAIDQLIFTIVNADAENTFYIDELISYTLPNIIVS